MSKPPIKEDSSLKRKEIFFLEREILLQREKKSLFLMGEKSKASKKSLFMDPELWVHKQKYECSKRLVPRPNLRELELFLKRDQLSETLAEEQFLENLQLHQR